MRSVVVEALRCLDAAVLRECSREDLELLRGTPVATSLQQYYIATDYICGQHIDGNV